MLDPAATTSASRQPLVAAPGEIQWRQFELPPQPAPSQVRVRTLVSLISPGTEMRLYEGGTMPSAVWNSMAELHRFTPHGAPSPRPMAAGIDRFPVSIGYNNVAAIEALGDGVDGLRLGQRVFVMGRHAEAFDVEHWEVVPIPAAISDEEAAPAYIPTLGLHALRRIAWSPGEPVAVIGLGLVGLGAALLADACGAELICLEADPVRRELAASVLPNARIIDPSLEPQALDSGSGYRVPAVIEAAGGERALQAAMSISADGGRIAVLALHPEPLDTILADVFYGREVALVSTSNDPYVPGGQRAFTVPGNVAFVLGLMARERLSLDGLRSGVFPAGTLGSVYAAISSKRDPGLVGALLDWRGDAQIPVPTPSETGSTADLGQSRQRGVANA